MTGSTSSDNLFWDSCVITRYLTGNPPLNVADIDLFLSEAVAKKRRIYISPMVVAEVKPHQLKQKPAHDWGDKTAYRLFNAATHALTGKVSERPSVTAELHKIIDSTCELVG